MARQPFILFKRASRATKSKTKGFWYVEFWDEERGEYVSARSTGKTSKGDATKIALKMLGEGGPRNTPLAAEWLESFWSMKSDYVKGRIARGTSMSKLYVENSARAIQGKIVPLLKEVCGPRVRLDGIKTIHLERILMKLSAEPGRATRTANAIFQALQVPLAEAFRLSLIPSNPASRVRKLSESSASRGILTTKEAKAFFDLQWKDRCSYGANLLAATAGLRLGEVRGLLWEHVHDGYIDVSTNWQDEEGIKAPKWHSVREVPVPKRTQEVLAELMKANPWGGPFVFWGKTADRPMRDFTIRGSFRSGLKAIEISEAEQTRRRLTFHSWRHFYNSMMRGRVADHALRQLTGHRSEAMTERYSHVTEEQRAAIVEVVSSYL